MGKKQEGMDIYVLLDRTGSMAPLWVEAVSSVNAYAKELMKDGADDRITLAAFDHYGEGMQFDILRDSVPISEWKDVDDDEVSPRGMTPLFDALVKLIARAEETVFVGHAEPAMGSTAKAHRAYRHSLDAVSYQDEDRKNAGEDEVK